MAKAKWKEWTTEHGLKQIEMWAAHGLTDEQIAKNIDIGMTTFYRWNNEHREIWEAIKKGKAVTDYEVESALFRRACGYDAEETMTEVADDGTKRTVKSRKTTRHIPPDVGAMCFWLKNRNPQDWRDKRDADGADSQTMGILEEVADYMNWKRKNE